MFSQKSCLLTQGEGPHLHPIIIPLVLGPFQGGGTPIHSNGGRGTCIQSRWGYPLERVALGEVMVWVVRLLRFPTGGLFFPPRNMSVFACCE